MKRNTQYCSKIYLLLIDRSILIETSDFLLVYYIVHRPETAVIISAMIKHVEWCCESKDLLHIAANSERCATKWKFIFLVLDQIIVRFYNYILFI